jgi:hypothetical protein
MGIGSLPRPLTAKGDRQMTDAIDWLLEKDTANPGIRYFALRDLLDHPAEDPQVLAAGQAVMAQGPVPAILDAQDPLGFWIEPGSGYYPKYRGTVWSLIYLAQLGADPADPRVQASGDYLLQHARAANGAFSMTGTPAGNIYCLAGNLAAALLDLGFSGDARLEQALDLMARFTTGEGIAPTEDKGAPLRYLKSGACGPGFRCSANNSLPCAWGAVKVLRALARVPKDRWTPRLGAALEHTVEFLFSVDPATAGYPAGYSDKPSRSWFRFGFPVFYVTDVLQIAEALTEAGYGGDPRLADTYDLILGKRDQAGRWKLEYAYTGKTWVDVEARGKPSKWVTLRAMRVLKGGGVET